MNERKVSRMLPLMLASIAAFGGLDGLHIPGMGGGRRNTNPLNLTLQQQAMLETFPDTREGIKAKKRYLKSLRGGNHG